jgi:hypothetical protein
MSILGIKKKRTDTSYSTIEKEILKIKSELLTIAEKDIYLFKSSNTLNLKLLNIENKVNHIKDRKIISVYAGIEGPLKANQLFNFGDGGNSFLMAYPGTILSFSILSARKPYNVKMRITIELNGKESPGFVLQFNETFNHAVFANDFRPLAFKAGDLLSFKSTTNNPECINTLVSVIVELIL